jgi:hypothetical protein
MVKTKVRLHDGAVVRIQQINADSGDLICYDGVKVLQIKCTDIVGMDVSDPIHPAPNSNYNKDDRFPIHPAPSSVQENVSHDALRVEVQPISTTHIKYPPLQEATTSVSFVPTKETTASTGSLRFNTGKSQTSELDPEFLLGMGRVLEKARQKYPRGNWSLGNNYSVPWDSMMRHLLAWQSGESLDEESGQNHLYHAALNLMMLAHYEQNFPEMDDRIFKKAKK